VKILKMMMSDGRGLCFGSDGGGGGVLGGGRCDGVGARGYGDCDERRLLVLGSTGSIGLQTLAVVEHVNGLHARGEWPWRFRVVGLAAGRRVAEQLELASRFGVRDLAFSCSLSEAEAAVGGGWVREFGDGGGGVRFGLDAAERLVREVGADVVMCAVVGSAGLGATLAAAELGVDIALANKEALVAAGALVVPAAMKSGARILPVDSEHAAIWQAMLCGGQDRKRCTDGGATQGSRSLGVGGRGAVRGESDGRSAGEGWGGGGGGAPPYGVCSSDVARVILTASGGALRDWPLERVESASVADALAHPTWAMGAKVTIDSASLTNKALEVIEAHWLFGIPAEKLEVVIHRQSVVHSLVEFVDGNVMAQLGANDMRIPIQHALTYPVRGAGSTERLDFARLGRLDFESPDLERFPALGLAWRVMEMTKDGGETAGAVFNAANECAVEAFLGGKIAFGRIARLAGGALDEVGVGRLRCLADVREAEREARAYVAASIGAGLGV